MKGLCQQYCASKMGAEIIPGLLVAAIVAAAMSAVSSTLNITADCHRHACWRCNRRLGRLLPEDVSPQSFNRLRHMCPVPIGTWSFIVKERGMW